MKAVLRIILLGILGIPLSLFAQRPNNPQCHAWFNADVFSGCSPLLVNFSDESMPPDDDPIVSWKWYFGDGTTSMQKNPAHMYNTGGIFHVKLVVRSKSGWKDSVKRKDLIHAGSLPLINLGRDTSLCESTTLVLDAGNAGASYLWSTGEESQTITVNQPGQYWAKVKQNGCTSSDSINISYRPQVWPNFGYQPQGTCLPVATQFTDSSTTCAGYSITQWQWEFGDGSTSNEQHPTHFYVSADTFIVRLTVTNNTGFSITRSKRVMIESTQTLAVNLGNDTTICQTEMLVLDAGNPGASYSWSNGEFFQSTVVTNSGQVWVEVYNNGCIGRDTIEVTVKPSTVPDFHYRQQGNCLPLPVSFTDSSQTCNVNIIQWQWDFGDGSVAEGNNPVHSYKQNGEYAVQMTITDDWGNSVTKSTMVIINSPSPVLNLGNDTTVCFGEIILLDAGNPGAEYLWNTGETEQEIAVMDDGKYWVRVRQGNCEVVDSIKVKTVMPVLPAFNYDITSKCLPVPVKFKDSSTTNCNTQVVQWRWDFGDGTTSLEQNPEHSFTRSDTFGVRLSVITNTGLIVSKSKKIYISNETPKVNLGQDITICKGESVQLDAGIEGASFLWTPSATLSCDSICKPLAKPLETTTYQVAVTRCMVTVRDDIMVKIDQLEKPVIRQDENMLISSEARTYQWYKNGEMIVNASSRKLKPEGVGYYSVKVTNKRGCDNESDKFFFIPHSKKDKGFKGIQVKCTPNPSPGYLNILLSHLPEKPILVTVIDRYGKRLFSTTISNNSNLLQLTSLAKGQYFLELIMDKERVMIPILIY